MEDILTPSQAMGQTSAMGPQAGAQGAEASQARWGSHPVNIRFTVPLLIRSYYVTILIGPERRSEERRAIERRNHPLFTLGNTIVYLVASAGWVVYIALVYKLISLGI
jgi:hypothetical protein